MPLLFLLLALTKISIAAPRGMPVAEDRCQEQCSLLRDGAGQAYVSCNCTKRGGALKPRGLASLAAFRKAFPANSVADAAEAIEKCEAAVRPSGSEFSGPEELAAVASLKTRPLCECVAARTRFAVSRACANHKTGETTCTFATDSARFRVERPLRRATLEDYQSCLASSANYRRPSSCGKVSRCPSELPACAPGLEAVNIADPEACCPVYVCRKESA